MLELQYGVRYRNGYFLELQYGIRYWDRYSTLCRDRQSVLNYSVQSGTGTGTLSQMTVWCQVQLVWNHSMDSGTACLESQYGFRYEDKCST